jgi:hypothetical protein
MNSSNGRGSSACLRDLRSGIEVHSQIAGRLLGIFRGLDSAERCFHFHTVALLVNAGPMSHPHGKKRERCDAKGSHEYDHANDDQNGFKSAAARTGRDGWSGGR